MASVHEFLFGPIQSARTSLMMWREGSRPVEVLDTASTTPVVLARALLSWARTLRELGSTKADVTTRVIVIKARAEVPSTPRALKSRRVCAGQRLMRRPLGRTREHLFEGSLVRSDKMPSRRDRSEGLPAGAPPVALGAAGRWLPRTIVGSISRIVSSSVASASGSTLCIQGASIMAQRHCPVRRSSSERARRSTAWVRVGVVASVVLAPLLRLNSTST